jgi:hypothetical protein
MDRPVYGTRINGRWCFVVNDAARLAACEGDVTTMDAECPCGENAMRLVALIPSDLTKWAMRCTRCGTFYPIAQMPTRQCVGSPPHAYRPPAWAVDLDERDANARYGLGG